MKEEVSIYLDALRVMAALAVLAEHASDFIGGWIWHFASYGAEAVAVFFVLSGFVIAHVSGRREYTASSYAAARALRMYSVVLPAMIITLLLDTVGRYLNPVVYAMSPYVAPSVSGYFQSLTFTHQLWNYDVHFGTNGPFWSLGFEVAYYAIFGVALFISNRFFKVVGVLLLLLFFGPRIAVYFPLWLIGVAAYWLLNGRSLTIDTALKKVPQFVWISVFLVSAAFFFLVHNWGHTTIDYLKIYRRFELSEAYLDTLLYFYALGALVAANIVSVSFLAHSNIVSAISQVAIPIRWMAGGTFTIYLLNLPVLLCLKAMLIRWENSGIKLAVMVALTLAICLLCAEFSERRKEGMKRMLKRAVGVLAR